MDVVERHGLGCSRGELRWTWAARGLQREGRLKVEGGGKGASAEVSRMRDESLVQRELVEKIKRWDVVAGSLNVHMRVVGSWLSASEGLRMPEKWGREGRKEGQLGREGRNRIELIFSTNSSSPDKKANPEPTLAYIKSSLTHETPLYRTGKERKAHLREASEARARGGEDEESPPDERKI